MKNEVKFIELDETVSTNTFLATYQAAEPAALTVVTADYQTAGRGQPGNSWESERGKNLLFSILVQPASLPASHVFALSEAIALSIREAIVSFLNLPSTKDESLSPFEEIKKELPVTVKWPNDVYVGDSKIAGILIENTLRGDHVARSVIGCGVNVNQTEFHFPSLTPHPSTLNPQPSTPIPVSLRQLIGHDCDRRDILHHILEAFRRRYDTLDPQPSAQRIHTDYLAALYCRTGLHPYRDAQKQFDAEIVDVEPSGHLVLREANGSIRRYAFKEIEYVRL